MDPTKYFFQNLVKNIQIMCQSQISFDDCVEVTGYVCLNIDKGQRFDFVLNEKGLKSEAALVFDSSSYHAGPSVENEKTGRKRRQIQGKDTSPGNADERLTKIQRVLSPVQSLTSNSIEAFNDQENADNVIKIDVIDQSLAEGLNDDSRISEGGEISSVSEHYETIDSSLAQPIKEEIYFQTEDEETLANCAVKMEVGEGVDIKNIEGELEYTIVEMGTKKGRAMLVDNIGYSYSIRRRTEKSTHWACTIRNKSLRCPATVNQIESNFALGVHNHSHPPKPGLLTSTLITAEARAQANNDFVTPTSEVVERAMTVKGEEDFSALPKQTNLKRMINRCRQQRRQSMKSSL